MDFKQFYKTINFDIDNEIRTVFQATQGDTKSRGLLVDLIVGGVKTPVTTENITFYALKPDGTRVMTVGVKEDTGFRIDFTNQTFAVPGVLLCTLVLSGTNGEKIADKKFKMTVDSSLEDGAIISEDERGILDRAFDLAEDIVPRLEGLDVPLLENVDSEITLARGTEPTLGARLDGTVAKTELEQRLQTVGDFVATNLIKNGHFTTDGVGWTFPYGTGSVENGLCKYTVDTLSQSSRIACTIPETIIGHKYYVFGMVKTPHNGVVKLAIGSQSILANHQASSELSRYSGIITSSEKTTLFAFFTDTSIGYATGEVIYFDNIGIIDLTALFGVGNEPTKLEMDELMLASFVSGYFDGSTDKIYTRKNIYTIVNDISSQLARTSLTFGDTLEWGIGGIIAANGMDIDSTTMIRTVNQVPTRQGKTIKLLDYSTYKFYVFEYDVNGDFLRGSGWLQAEFIVGSDTMYFRILFAKVVNGNMTQDDLNTIPLILVYDPLILADNIVSSTSHGVKIGGIGQPNASITSGDGAEYVLSAIKSLVRRSTYGASVNPVTPQMAVGYLYHMSLASASNDIFYSANRADNPTKIGTLDFSPHGWQSAISEAGDIIWVKSGSHSTKPRICLAGNYDTSIEIDIPSERLPSGWLQNCGVDFAFDSNGNEYFIFSEYNVDKPIYVWKVTQPYTDPANWRKVFTKDVVDGITHFHTCNHDPFSNVWYVTSGDHPDINCKWWYSDDEGETWNDLTAGTIHYPAQVARVLNFVFTEDYLYWANDYGTNHCLSRVSRDINGVADPTTWEKVAELNKRQSTYATILTHSPSGILLLDRVDIDFSVATDELQIQFWSFDDEELYTLKTLKRDPSKTQYFGFRCKTYSLYQGIYDTRIIVGFDEYPNWLSLPYNINERRTTLTLDIF